MRLRQDEKVNRKFNHDQYRQKISEMSTPTLQQLFYLAMIHLEYPLLLCLVLAGIDKMDLYHILLLIFFVVYLLFPDSMSKWSIALAVYADFFVIEKYIYTLTTT